MKGILRAMPVNHLVSTHGDYDEGEEITLKKCMHEQVIVLNAVMLYVKLHIIKKLHTVKDCASLFKPLKEKYNWSNASHQLYKKSLLIGILLKKVP